MANQISYNNKIIINNPLFFQNKNNINILNNQIPNSNLIPEQKRQFVDYLPGNNNRRINICFQTQSKYNFYIVAPINIRVKDLLLASAKEMGISPDLLGKNIFFLFNGHRIRINEEKDLISYGFVDCSKIIVLDTINMIGGNPNFYSRIKMKNFKI